MESSLRIEVRYPVSRGKQAAEEELGTLLDSMQSQDAIVNQQFNQGEFKHWLEVASLTVGIITSSISALKVIYDWVKDKKQKDEATQIIIYIDNRELNLISNRKEILAVLETQLNKKKG